MVTSAFLFALMSVGVKVSARSLPNIEVVFFRNAVGLLALIPWVVPLGWRGLATRNFREHLIRGVAGLGAMYCFFYAIGHLRLADAVLLNYSIPLFMPMVEHVWLGEPFSRRLWWPIGLGFVGIVFILKPGMGLFQPAALVGVASALFASVAQVGIRRLTRTEPIVRIVFYFSVLSTSLSALPVPFAWKPPQGRVWIAVLALGVCATLAQLMLTRAYAHAPAAQVGPFVYTAVVFAAALDWGIWGVLPDRLAVLGALLVGASGIAALRITGEEVAEPA
jgi:drug/metabolite transporter (DMT)-like permease